MNPIRAIGRLACILAGLAIAFAATAPAALAIPRPLPPGWYKHPPLPADPQPAVRFSPGWNKHPPLPAHAHALAAAGMPGWQVTLIAAAALAAALAVTGYRILAARRRATPSAA